MNSIIKPVRTDYNTNIRFLEELMKDFPFLDTEIQGRSSLGRAVFSFSLGNRKNSSLLAGGFHGTDFISTLLLMLFTEGLCRSVKYGTQMCGTDVKRALSKVGITVIPCINPDGAEIAAKGFEAAKNLRSYLSDIIPEGHTYWKANASGTDIYRNFSRGWTEYRQKEYEKGISSPCASGFCGAHAESEAETRIITRLCRLKPFTRCMTLTTGKNELYRHKNEATTAASAMIGKILADSASCSFNDGSSDEDDATLGRWFCEEFSLPSFTLGIRSSDTLRDGRLYSLYESIEEALLLFMLM